MFTRPWKWAREFLYTRILRKREELPKTFIRRIIAALERRVVPLFEVLREHARARRLFLLALLTPALILFVLTILLPLWANPFEIQSESEALKQSSDRPRATEPADLHGVARLDSLARTEVFWQARSSFAKSDSISLIADLRDSLVMVEIRGVPVRRCRIQHYRASRAFEHYRGRSELVQWLSTPFVLRREVATIPKAPLRVKKAPKDTLEAQAQDDEFLFEEEDVHFTLRFDRNLSISFAQTQNPSFLGWLHTLFYSLRRNASDAGETLSELLRLRMPRHHLWIEIEIVREDAKAIYRALPPRAKMALHL